MDYELIDSGDGRRLERFGDYLLDRPDPEVLWKKSLSRSDWEKADARFDAKWIQNVSIPDKWVLNHNDISFYAKLTPFKHTGVFPEQSVQWDFLNKQIAKSTNSQINVLNLFAYTGIATLFAAKAGAKVTHVDSSKPAVTWANENRELNGMQDAPIRWIVDDVLKFTEREVKRGNKYDVILMDPPVYGHGPTGTPWEFSRDFPKLLENCKQLLSDNPLFVQVNAYAISSSSTTLTNTLQGTFGDLGGNIENGELTLKEKSAGRLLSTGIWARWSADVVK
ncbi:MAG TPA: class I SAM-dependent methyltransferase [Patescibacteria group bacterium]|nr:class I SAM-dependent methyltransferase [Patescibacteria group bacterium]